jgi:cell division protease FtsH
LPNEERKDIFKEYLEDRIAMIMGGRAADELIYGLKSTGASNDISKATDLARKMVCEWGMSDKLGPLSFGHKEEQIFLGRELSRHRDYSESTAVDIDNEIRRIVNENYRRAYKILEENIDMLKHISDILLERENLNGDELDLLLDGKELPPLSTDKQPTSQNKHLLKDEYEVTAKVLKE